MTLKYNMTCDKCGFKSESVIDFANKTFSRVATDGSFFVFLQPCENCMEMARNEGYDKGCGDGMQGDDL